MADDCTCDHPSVAQPDGQLPHSWHRWDCSLADPLADILWIARRPSEPIVDSMPAEYLTGPSPLKRMEVSHPPLQQVPSDWYRENFLDSARERRGEVDVIPGASTLNAYREAQSLCNSSHYDEEATFYMCDQYGPHDLHFESTVPEVTWRDHS